MPLEVRIDVVPHGIEAARKTLRTLTITQVEKLDDDPGGERIYEVKGSRTARVQHARKDGASTLAAKALAVYFGSRGDSLHSFVAAKSPEWLEAWLDGFECGSGIAPDRSIIEFATERWASGSYKAVSE